MNFRSGWKKGNEPSTDRVGASFTTPVIISGATSPAARAMAAKGRELFLDQFRAETMVRRIAALYTEELSRAGIAH